MLFRNTKQSYSKIQKTLWNEESSGQETKCSMWEKNIWFLQFAHILQHVRNAKMRCQVLNLVSSFTSSIWIILTCWNIAVIVDFEQINVLNTRKFICVSETVFYFPISVVSDA